MLPKPSKWSRGEEHVFYVIRAYRLGVLVLIRPFLWQHVRQSAEGASSTIAAATYMVPGVLLPLLDLVRTYTTKIEKKCMQLQMISEIMSRNALASIIQTLLEILRTLESILANWVFLPLYASCISALSYAFFYRNFLLKSPYFCSLKN